MELKDIVNALDYFVGQYSSTPNRGFFHRHGSTGKIAANQFVQEWETSKCSLLQTTFDSTEAAICAVQEQLKKSMRSPVLTGNYFKHSLKNYILSYYDALSALRTGVSMANSKKELFNELFTNKWSKADPSAIHRSYNRVANIKEPALYHGVPVTHWHRVIR